MFISGGFRKADMTAAQVRRIASKQQTLARSLCCAQAHRRSCALACLSIIAFFVTGCTQIKQLQNLDPLLTLKDFSDEKDGQAKWVDGELQRFEGLMAAVKDGSINDITTKDSVRERFGDPVVIDRIMQNDISVERWLYRHPIQKLATDRVYFFFDADGRFLRFERVGPTDNA